MHNIKIKPLSVNQSIRNVRGRTLKSKAYREYEKELMWLLPKFKAPEGKLQLIIIVGYSNKLSDIDNCIKPFIDVLQKKYDFNDRNIYRLEINKEITKKGEEFIKFKLEEL